MFFSCTIPTRCPSKKNTQKVVRKHGRTFVLYTKQFREWEALALATLKQAWSGRDAFTEPMEARFRFYFKNHQHEADLSNIVEAPQDALQKAGVIKDDKLIWIARLEKFFGEEPRVEIELYPYASEEIE